MGGICDLEETAEVSRRSGDVFSNNVVPERRAVLSAVRAGSRVVAVETLRRSWNCPREAVCVLRRSSTRTRCSRRLGVSL